MGVRPEGHTIDRIDSAKNYCKENCRWSTHKEQQRNLRTNKRFPFQGEELTIGEISERCGIVTQVLRYRLKVGWPMDVAASVPAKYGNRNLANK
jgi:hypothetical protein